MPRFLDWRSAAVACSLAAVLAAFAWHFRRTSAASPKTDCRKRKRLEENGGPVEYTRPNDHEDEVQREAPGECEVSESDSSDNETITDLPEPRWVKVGQVQELYVYPLKSGRGRNVAECEFTEFGIGVRDSGRLALRDRMFLVYNEENRRFETSRKYPTLILVSLSAVDEFRVRLEAVGMPSVVFGVPENAKGSAEAVECTMWWGEPVKCIDCGPEAAEWISRFLTGTNSGLRVGCAMPDRRQILKGPWARYAKVYNTLRREDSVRNGLFADLASYMLMSSRSLDELNDKLERPVPIVQFRPNIVVSGTNAFDEDNWEWIKIGESAVIRNVKPCARCSMVKVDPEMGTADNEEPLKTLRSFREQTDPERVALEGSAPVLGIYCGLYVAGKVRTGDDVYVHTPDKSTEIRYRQMSPTDES